MFAYVGGYTTEDRNGHGNGINVWHVDADGERWTHLQHIGGLENPSLFTLNRTATRLYSVHGGRRLVSAFAIDRASGQLSLLNQVDCEGVNPVDSALDPTERFLVVANYGTGSVAVLPVAPDGRLEPVSQLLPLEGAPGPDPKEQASSHPHAVVFDPSGEIVVVPDKGFDRTYFFQFRDGRLAPTAQGSIASAPGAGPRHAAFHPALPVLYVNNELDSTVTVFDWRAGCATERQIVSTLQESGNARNTTAEIAVSTDGRHVYVSNRGEDSIVHFLAGADGGLSYVEATKTGGACPRFFALAPDGRHLYAANQDGHDINIFRIDSLSGRLTSAGVRIGAGSPSAISFIMPT